MLRIVVRAIFHADRHSQQVLKLVSGGRVVMVMTHQIQEEVLLAVAGHAWQAGVDFEQARRPLQKALRLTQKRRRSSAAVRTAPSQAGLITS